MTALTTRMGDPHFRSFSSLLQLIFTVFHLRKTELCNFKYYTCGTENKLEIMEKAYLALKNVS